MAPVSPIFPVAWRSGGRGEEALTLPMEAIDFHIDGLLADGVPLPRPRCDIY